MDTLKALSGQHTKKKWVSRNEKNKKEMLEIKKINYQK